MNTKFNEIFNKARKLLGEAAIVEIIKSVDSELQDVTIKGRGHQREQLGLSSKNVVRVMQNARYAKVSTGTGYHNYKIMFPKDFVAILELELLEAIDMWYDDFLRKQPAPLAA